MFLKNYGKTGFSREVVIQVSVLYKPTIKIYIYKINKIQ